MSIEVEIIKVTAVSIDIIDYNILIFKINPEKRINSDNSNELWIILNTLIDAGVKKILVDLKLVEYIDSSGIGIFINATKKVRKKQGDLVLANTSKEIKEIFKVINLQNFIKIYNTDTEASNYFRLSFPSE